MVSAIDMPQLQAWIGRRTESEETIAPSPAAALAAMLDRESAPQLGEPLPPLWHWIYFTPRARQSELGPDGHPRLGGFMPPVPLPRRMWAGGRLSFAAPILVGDRVLRETEILNITQKTGRDGALLFVTLKHQLSTHRGVAIEEEQDLVYREPSETVAVPPKAPTGDPAPALWRERLRPDSTLLFRYSALTFNAHRIHYDASYAKQIEGYRGLVVQGPLTATLLVDRLLARTAGRLTEFSFRGQRPLFADESFGLRGEHGEATDAFRLWAETPDGTTAMSATARLASV